MWRMLIFCSLMLLFPKQSSSEGLGANQSYIFSILPGAFSEASNEGHSLSLLNEKHVVDKEAIKSFSDAYLWATGIKTDLRLGRRARLNILYVESFEEQRPIEISDKLIARIYTEKLPIIENFGHCGKTIISGDGVGESIHIVYIDKNASFEHRISCIYRHYRAMFGIGERAQADEFGDTFVSDLRVLRCRAKYKDIEIASAMLRNGGC